MDEGFLLRGAPLAAAEGWLLLRTSEISYTERKFIKTSLQKRKDDSRNQFLIISSILLGIYHSPLPGDTPTLNTVFITAYFSACVVPFLIYFLPPLKYYDRHALPLFRYAPYILMGIFWKPMINFFGNLFN